MKTLSQLFLCILMLCSLQAEVKKKPLVLHHIVKDCPVVLQDEYGVMLLNDGWEKDPSPRYIFARLSTRTVLITKDLSEFQHALARIPKGTVIHEYGSCTVPRWHGLTDKHFESYNSVFKKLGLKISENSRITCYCKKVSK